MILEDHWEVDNWRDYDKVDENDYEGREVCWNQLGEQADVFRPILQGIVEWL